MIEDHTPDRREQLRRQIAELALELETLPPPPTVDALIKANHDRANAPNALRPNRRTP